MSVSLTLIPVAIGILMVTNQACADISEKLFEAQKQNIPCDIETTFTDTDLLYKTLKEHGMNVTVVDADTIKAVCPESTLVFERSGSDQTFHLKLNSSKEIAMIKDELDDLNEEYGLNVQSYTYNHVKENLEEGMTIASEEVLEDNSILLTINLD